MIIGHSGKRASNARLKHHDQLLATVSQSFYWNYMHLGMQAPREPVQWFTRWYDNHQESQRLVAAKRRLAKQGLTVPRLLRSLVKRVRKACWGCNRFQATPLDPPPHASLPTDRVRGERAFEVVRVGFAGPIYYKRGTGRQGKPYLVLYSCSLIRAVHLEILPNFETRSTKEGLFGQRGNIVQGHWCCQTHLQRIK